MIDDLWHESSAAQLLLEEGRLEGMRLMAQKALQARFGALDEELIQAIQSAPAVLTDLIEEANLSLEQVRAKLKQGS